MRLRSQRPTAALTIAVIPKGTSHVFWQSIHAGAEKAAQELGVDVIWRGPLREDDRDSQVSEVEGFVTRGVSGIVLAPLDDAALAQPVADAKRRGIPVVIIDSGLKGSDYVSFVATDNRKGGRLAGEQLAGLLQRHGQGRDAALRRRIREHDAARGRVPRGDRSAARASRSSARTSTAARTSKARTRRARRCSAATRRRRRLGVDGIFTPNESTTLAMLRVLQDNGWAGKVKFVGFDASETLVKGLTRRAHRRPGAAGSGQHGLSRREDDGRAPQGRAGREADRHRRAADHARAR